MTIEIRDGEVLFRFDPRKGKDAARISEMVYAWAPVAEKYRAGEIGKEEYDQRRYGQSIQEQAQRVIQNGICKDDGYVNSANYGKNDSPIGDKNIPLIGENIIH